MGLRTIMIFPHFDNIEIINNIRIKYDPLALLVKPHITLVFPFALDLSNEELKIIITEAIDSMNPFEIELSGYSKHQSNDGNYLFLDIVKGYEEVINLHNCLYDKLLALKKPHNYIPHITIGKLKTIKDMEEAFASIINIRANFKGRVEVVSVEKIGNNGESIILMDLPL